MSAFAEELVSSGIPFIDRTYRTIADKEHRAMAGLSMGGILRKSFAQCRQKVQSWYPYPSKTTMGTPAARTVSSFFFVLS